MRYIINDKIDLNNLLNLYASVGWLSYANNPQKMSILLQNSLWWCSCWDDDQLIGLVRVVGDGFSIVYIQDLLVNPNYQLQGIGTYLMNEVFNTFSDVRQIVLITDNTEKTKLFYESAGMKELSKTNAIGYIKYNT